MSSLAINMFGSMQVMVDSQPIPAFRSRKALWLLALLTLRANRPVERERLASMLWPDNDHSRALANLRTVLSELRIAMGEEGSRLCTHDRRAISIDLEGVSVDLLNFDSAIASPDVKRIEQAIELYSGSLLEGCSEEWVYQERTAREVSCIEGLQKLADFALSNGNNRAAINWYRRATQIDPWWEPARRGVMEALARDGDINEALQLYRSYEELLRSDSRSVPDEQTTALYSRLRNRARTLQAKFDEKSVDPSNQIEGYLPCPVNSLIGREDEQNDVVSILRRSRFVTLTGVGGIGKTRLAIAVAKEMTPEFVDGVWFVALESLSDGELIAQQLGAVLGVSENPSESWIRAVSNHIRKKRLLVLLDNCEHILDSCIQVTTDLLQECPGLRILTTSREIFGTPGETVWQVPGLTVPDPNHLPDGQSTMLRVLSSYDCVQFFVERAKAANRDFTLTPSNARMIASICFQLDGVPLAVELAAARMKSMTADQILDRLGDHFGLLRSSSRLDRPRQYALKSTLNWSHNLLLPAEQALLRRLSIFIGGWKLSMAEDICSDLDSDTEVMVPRESVLDLLSSLVDKSLVKFHVTDSGPRYRFLEMVRQYAKKRLDESSETPELKERLLAWSIAEIEEAQDWIGRPEQLDRINRLEAEYPNLRAVLEECLQHETKTGEAMQMVAGLQVFLHRSGKVGEGWKFTKRVLEADTAKSRTLNRARVLRAAITLAGPEIGPETTNLFMEEALEIFRELDVRQEICQSVHGLGNAAFIRNDYASAEKYFTEELTLSDELGDSRGNTMAICSLSMVHFMRGHYRAARQLLDEAEPKIRAVSDLNVLAWCLNHYGGLVRLQGELDTAKALLEESLSISRSIGFTAVIIGALNNIAYIANDQDDFDWAKVLVHESITISEGIGDMFGKSLWLRTLGMIAMSESDLDFADIHLKESLRLGIEYGDHRCRAGNMLCVGKLAVLKQEYQEAQLNFRESLRLHKEISDEHGVTECFEEIAGLELANGDIRKAVEIWAVADALREKNGFPMIDKSRKIHDERLASARLNLTKDVFDSLWKDGRSENWEHLVTRIIEGSNNGQPANYERKGSTKQSATRVALFDSRPKKLKLPDVDSNHD